MIPRYQRILFWTLTGAILLMALLMLRGCVRTHQHIVETRDQSPIAAPIDSPAETVTIAEANDADGSINEDQITLSLPSESSVRARVLLDRVLADAAQPGAPHPLPPGPAVSDVFFVKLPVVPPTPNTSANPFTQTPADTPQSDRNARGPSFASSPYGANHADGAVLAVVNLTKSFADAHPSSIEAEDLTLRSLVDTLHANFTQVEEVRFLVDGQTRETLAGHADLTRPFPVSDPARSIHPLATDGSPE